jgi:hypothetical protein
VQIGLPEDISTLFYYGALISLLDNSDNGCINDQLLGTIYHLSFSVASLINLMSDEPQRMALMSGSANYVGDRFEAVGMQQTLNTS